MLEEEKVNDETLEVEEDVVETPETPQQEEVDLEALKKSEELAENYKIRAEKAEKALKRTEKPKQDKPVESVEHVETIDSIDQIKLGKKLHDYSDDELDFVTDYAKSKKPEDILEALKNPFVQQGINAHREKVEKEKLTLSPSSTQTESDEPQSFNEKLSRATSLEDKEKLLESLGLYKSPRPKKDRVKIENG